MAFGEGIKEYRVCALKTDDILDPNIFATDLVDDPNLPDSLSYI